MCLLATDQEYNIALRRVDIGILQQEHAVYTVLLQYRELDKQPDWTSQLLANHQILLAPNLRSGLV